MKQCFLAFQEYISRLDVPRETVEKLITYHDLLLKWQRKINLVSNSTLENAWERHFLDSAQLYPLLSDVDKPIFDLGSGAGFPGLVLSILGAKRISLLESDQRKCIFLSEVIRETKATAKVINERIELPKKTLAHTVTSRACASLDQLLTFSEQLLAEGGECIFLKGRGAAQEIEEAKKRWVFHVEQFPSIVDKEGSILRIRNLRRIDS